MRRCFVCKKWFKKSNMAETATGSRMCEPCYNKDPVKAEAGELLAQAEDLLGGAETALVEGDEGLADEMVEEAEEIIDNIDDLLGDYVMGNGKGQNPDKGNIEAKSN